MIKTSRILNLITAGLMVGHMAACASAQDNNLKDAGVFRDVFIVAKAVNQSELPQTTEEWKIITDKIENGKVDESVFLATFSDAWPKEYDKLSVRQQHINVLMESGNVTEGGLPSSDELNAIWKSMLQEIEQQQTEKKTTKD